MKVLVTGGAGFIGSHIVNELLLQNYEVYVLDNFSSGKLENIEEFISQIHLICGDITSAEIGNIIGQIQPDYVIHLAAQPSVAISQKNPLLDVRTNLYGLVNLLEACKKSKCRKIVFATSGGTIYGDVDEENIPLKEDLPLQALSFYGLTKLTSVHYLELYKRHFGLPYCALALGNVYGPKQDPYGESGVVAIFTNKILNDEECTINGDGSVTRDYVYCSDVAKGFVKALHKGEGILNLGTGIETDVAEVYNTICQVSGKKAKVKHVAALPGEVKRVALCSDKMEKELDWRPSVSFMEGIKLTWDAFSQKKVREVDKNVK